MMNKFMTNTPIALINTQVGGTWIEQWIDIETVSAIPAAQLFMGIEGLPDASLLYNGRVAPLQPFGVGGVIWYQGEGNTQANLDSVGYVDELKGLINSWRQQWGDADLPFLVVQLPLRDAAVWAQVPAVRNAQAQAAHDLDGVELAVIIDTGDGTVHPAEKEPVGERLALLARAKVYGGEPDWHLHLQPGTRQILGPPFQQVRPGLFNDTVPLDGSLIRAVHLKRRIE